MFKKIQHHYKGVSSLNFIPKIWISLQFFYLILPWIQVKQQLNDGTEYVTLMEKHLSKAAAWFENQLTSFMPLRGKFDQNLGVNTSQNRASQDLKKKGSG